MNGTACSLLRHDIRPRWIGDLHAAYCRTCDCIYVEARTPRAASDTPFSPGRVSPALLERPAALSRPSG